MGVTNRYSNKDKENKGGWKYLCFKYHGMGLSWFFHGAGCFAIPAHLDMGDGDVPDVTIITVGYGGMILS